jgi:predicted CopG family antitoxin
MSTKFRNIVISERNYNVLKDMGRAGESFNDVLTSVLKELSRSLEGDSERG